MRIRNVHQRFLAVPPQRVGALLDTLSSPQDRLWPGKRWPPLRFDGPLAVGARGGHGPVRYRVAEHVPGRSVVFEFEPHGLTRGMAGGHRFEVTPAQGGALLRHVLEARASVWSALRWGIVIRPLHDALLEDALDNAERELTGSVCAPARWSGWVRLVRRMMRRR